jgi:hypothetical protein
VGVPSLRGVPSIRNDEANQKKYYNQILSFFKGDVPMLVAVPPDKGEGANDERSEEEAEGGLSTTTHFPPPQ